METVAREASVLTRVKLQTDSVSDIVYLQQELQKRRHTIHGLQLLPPITASLQTPGGPAELPSLKGDPALLAIHIQNQHFLSCWQIPGLRHIERCWR